MCESCKFDCFNCTFDDCFYQGKDLWDIDEADKMVDDELRIDRLRVEEKLNLYLRQAKYNKTIKGMARTKRYHQSEKGKEAAKRYEQSEKGKDRMRKYEQSEWGKERQRRYRMSEKGKASIARKRAREKQRRLALKNEKINA